MDARIGDAERDAATSRLGDHFAAGRLDHEEFAERLDAIWSARTRADLDQLFWDLPRATAALAPVRPAPVVRRRRRTPVVAILVIAVLVAFAVFDVVPLVLLIAAVWLVFIRPRRRHTQGWHGEKGSCR